MSTIRSLFVFIPCLLFSIFDISDLLIVLSSLNLIIDYTIAVVQLQKIGKMQKQCIELANVQECCCLFCIFLSPYILAILGILSTYIHLT